MGDQSETVVPTEERRLLSQRLVELLVGYVSEADTDLPRDLFLRVVMNRIVDELCAPLPRPR